MLSLGDYIFSESLLGWAGYHTDGQADGNQDYQLCERQAGLSTAQAIPNGFGCRSCIHL